MRTHGANRYRADDSDDDEEDDSVVVDDNSWREETLRAAYSGWLSRAAMEHELDHLRGIQAIRERKLEEARRRAIIHYYTHDLVSILLAFSLLFILGWYKLGFQRNCGLLVDFVYEGKFNKCSPKEGLWCTFGSFILLVGYLFLLMWTVWAWKLEEIWRKRPIFVFLGAFAFVALTVKHYGWLNKFGMGD